MNDCSEQIRQLIQLAQTHQAECDPVVPVPGGECCRVHHDEKTVTVSIYFKRGNGQVQPTGSIQWIDEWIAQLPSKTSAVTSSEHQGPPQSTESLWIPESDRLRRHWVELIEENLPNGNWQQNSIYRASQATITLHKEKLVIQGKNPIIPVLKQKLIEMNRNLLIQEIQNSEVSQNALHRDSWGQFCENLQDEGYSLLKNRDSIVRKESKTDTNVFEIHTEDDQALAHFQVSGSFYSLIDCDPESKEDIEQIYSGYCGQEKGKILGFFKIDNEASSTFLIAIHEKLLSWLKAQPTGNLHAESMLSALQKKNLCSKLLTSRKEHPKEKGQGWKKISQMWFNDIERLKVDTKNPIAEWDSFYLGVPDSNQNRNLGAFVPSNIEVEVLFVMNKEDNSLRSFMESIASMELKEQKEVC